MRKFKYLLVVLIFVASACSYSARSFPDLSIQMLIPHDSPSINTMYLWLSGYTMNLKAIANVRRSGGADRIIFYINGRNIGTLGVLPDEVSPSATLDWTPTTGGEYFVQAQVISNSGSSAMSAAVRVCVLGSSDTIDLSVPYVLWGYGFNGPCAIPPTHPTIPDRSYPISIHTITDPISIGYDSPDFCVHRPGVVYAGSAGVTFTTTITDPLGLVAFVTVRVIATGPSGSIFDSLILNQTGGGPTGTRTFRGSTIEMDSDLSSVLGNRGGNLNWEARAIDNAGYLLASESQSMLAGPCAPPVHALTIGTDDKATPTLISILPSPTEPATPTATATPTDQSSPQLIFLENANCHKGPGTAYDVATSFVKGKLLPAVGRNESSSWWLVQIQPGSTCWVGDAAVVESGPVELLPVTTAPSLPETPAKMVNSNVCDLKLNTLTVNLNWASVSDATGFKIYRNGSPLTSVGGEVTSYTDSAPLGVDLTYGVEAVNAYGHSDQVTTSVPACK
jgi:hypothetical protein